MSYFVLNELTSYSEWPDSLSSQAAIMYSRISILELYLFKSKLPIEVRFSPRIKEETKWGNPCFSSQSAELISLMEEVMYEIAKNYGT